MRTTFAALRHRDYRVWTAAGLVSVTGTWMQILGVNWYVLTATGSPAQMGLTVLLQALPVLLLGPLGGMLADRLPARPLLIATQAAHAALAAVLVVAVLSSSATTLPVVYAASVAGGLISALEGPVMGRFSASLVDRDTLGNALALGSVVSSAGRVLGMSVGGVLAATAGPAALFALNATSFVGVIIAVLAVRARAPRPAPSTTATAVEAQAGLSVLRANPMLLTTLLLALVLGGLGRNYQVTMAAMSDGPLHAGAAGYGLLSTVFAVGTILGGLVAAHRRVLGYRTLVGAGLITSGLQILAGLAPGLVTFGGLILPIAAGAVLIDTTVATRAQLDTGEEMRGRVLAAIAVVSSGSSALGAPLLGWLAEWIGVRETLVVAGAAAALASALAGYAIARRRGHRMRVLQVRLTLRESLGIRTARLREAEAAG